MQEKKMLLLVNPKAGQKKAAKALWEIIDIFNRAGYSVITHITAGNNDGRQAVLQHAEDVDVVVCSGGDGTFNETISGVIESGKNIPRKSFPGE